MVSSNLHCCIGLRCIMRTCSSAWNDVAAILPPRTRLRSVQEQQKLIETARAETQMPAAQPGVELVDPSRTLRFTRGH